MACLSPAPSPNRSHLDFWRFWCGNQLFQAQRPRPCVQGFLAHVEIIGHQHARSRIIFGRFLKCFTRHDGAQGPPQSLFPHFEIGVLSDVAQLRMQQAHANGFQGMLAIQISWQKVGKNNLKRLFAVVHHNQMMVVKRQLGAKMRGHLFGFPQFDHGGVVRGRQGRHIAARSRHKNGFVVAHESALVGVMS